MNLDQGDSITEEALPALHTKRTGDVFSRHLFVRVAYLRMKDRKVPKRSAVLRPSKGCLSSCKWATRTNKWRQKTSPVSDGSGFTVIKSP